MVRSSRRTGLNSGRAVTLNRKVGFLNCCSGCPSLAEIKPGAGFSAPLGHPRYGLKNRLKSRPPIYASETHMEGHYANVSCHIAAVCFERGCVSPEAQDLCRYSSGHGPGSPTPHG